MLTSFEFIYGLLSIKGVGKKSAKNFLDSNEMSFEKSLRNFESTFDDAQREQFGKGVGEAIAIERKCASRNYKVITCMDDGFSKKLLNGSNPCLFLFYAGDISLIKRKSVAVIGTRYVDAALLKSAEPVIKNYVDNDYVIVSGLALGCDTFAHKKALEYGGSTIAVLPSPVDDILPKSNTDLAEEIVRSNSLLISEYPPDTIYHMSHFVERDRIQSFLSNEVLVIYTKENGGSKYCMAQSKKDGKPVFTLSEYLQG